MGPRLRHRQLDDGTRIGVVLATQSPNFHLPALNKGELERLRSALRNGKLDAGFVVWARANGGRYTFCASMTLEEVTRKLDEHGVQPREGVMGAFYVVPFLTLDETVGW